MTEQEVNEQQEVTQFSLSVLLLAVAVGGPVLAALFAVGSWALYLALFAVAALVGLQCSDFRFRSAAAILIVIACVGMIRSM